MKELVIKTSQHTAFVEITEQVQAVVDGAGVKEGICICFVPHTTAGITINENADPDVARDMERFSDELVPQNPRFRHSEGNSDAHWLNAQRELLATSHAVSEPAGAAKASTRKKSVAKPKDKLKDKLKTPARKSKAA